MQPDQYSPNQAVNAAPPNNSKSSPRPTKSLIAPEPFSLRALKPLLTPTPRVLTRSNSRYTDLSAHRYIDRSPTTAGTAASRPPLRPHAASQPEIAKPVTPDDETSASDSHRTRYTWELGSAVDLIFWTEIAFGKTAATGRAHQAATAGAGRQESRQASGSASLRARGASKTSRTFARANSVAAVKAGGPNVAMAVQGSLKSPKTKNAGQLPAPANQPEEKDMRIIRQGFEMRLKDEGCFRKTQDGWLGFILKRKAKDNSTKLVPSSIEVGAGDISNIALTGGQWMYGVAARNGDVHVCAINLGAVYTATMQYIYENQKRLRQEAKIEGYWPRFRISVELPQNDTIFKWLCKHKQEGAKHLSRRWSLKNVGSAPTPGLIRQDLTWSISPFRSMLSEATGLKGSFIPISKFGKGYKRWLLTGSSSALVGEQIPAYDQLELSALPAAWSDKLNGSASDDFSLTPKEVAVKEAECSDQLFDSKGDLSPSIADAAVPRMLLVKEALYRVP